MCPHADSQAAAACSQVEDCMADHMQSVDCMATHIQPVDCKDYQSNQAALFMQCTKLGIPVKAFHFHNLSMLLSPSSVI